MVLYGVVQYGMVWRWHGNQGGARLKSTQAGGSPLAWHGFPHLVKCNKMAEKAVKKMGWNLGNSLIKKICLNLKIRKVSSPKTKRSSFNESDQVLSKLVLEKKVRNLSWGWPEFT